MLNFKEDQKLFQREGSLQEKRLIQKEKSNFSPKKVLFHQCHIVVLTVKPIYGTRIRNDVVDGVEMDEVKLRYIESITILQFYRYGMDI